MWKSKKFIIPVVVIVVLLVVSIAGVALADEGAKTGPRKALLARVAQILGTDQQKLENAFKQALDEKRGEFTKQREKRLDDWLAKLVTDGKITQQQANDFKKWTAAKPEGIPPVGIKGLEKLLQDGKITQAQFDAHKKWIESKPNIPLPKPDRKGPLPGKGFPKGPVIPPKTS